MHPIRSFVVRIYRQDRRLIVGQVEDVRTGKTTFFQSFAGLWQLLTAPTRAARRPTASTESAPPTAGGTP